MLGLVWEIFGLELEGIMYLSLMVEHQKLTLYLFTVFNICTPIAGLAFNIKSKTGWALDGRQSGDTVLTGIIAPNGIGLDLIYNVVLCGVFNTFKNSVCLGVF